MGLLTDTFDLYKKQLEKLQGIDNTGDDFSGMDSDFNRSGAGIEASLRDRKDGSPLTQEGALKMMEVAYLPCIAYPGGELKHGPIALIEEGTPVIAIAPKDSTIPLMESSIRECKSRGARIILITDSEDHITELADVVIPTQSTHPMLSPIINLIPLQLLAYHLGLVTGNNVDRPRNLAKSVTVV